MRAQQSQRCVGPRDFTRLFNHIQFRDVANRHSDQLAGAKPDKSPYLKPTDVWTDKYSTSSTPAFLELISRADVAIAVVKPSLAFDRAGEVLADGLFRFVFEHHGGERQIDVYRHLVFIHGDAALNGEGHALEGEIGVGVVPLDVEVAALKVLHRLLQRGSGFFGGGRYVFLMRYGNGDFGHGGFPF